MLQSSFNNIHSLNNIHSPGPGTTLLWWLKVRVVQGSGVLTTYLTL